MNVFFHLSVSIAFPGQTVTLNFHSDAVNSGRGFKVSQYQILDAHLILLSRWVQEGLSAPGNTVIYKHKKMNLYIFKC